MKTSLILVLLAISAGLLASLVFAANNETCSQVITSAFNPKSGACNNFSTPCEVPKKWVIGECPSASEIENMTECKKTCNLDFANSSKQCSLTFKNSVHLCNEARKTAFLACQNLTGKEKRACLKIAINTSKICKAEANLAKKQCKLSSKTTRAECMQACQLEPE